MNDTPMRTWKITTRLGAMHWKQLWLEARIRRDCRTTARKAGQKAIADTIFAKRRRSVALLSLLK